MRDIGIFDVLVDQVYDAAFDSSLWPAFLRSLQRSFGGPATLRLREVRSDAVGFMITEGQEQAYGTSFREYFAKLNPWIAAAKLLPVSHVRLSHEMVDRDIFERSEFYNDWLRPQDAYFGMGAILARSEQWETIIGLIRPQRAGAFSETEAELLGRLLPHLARALAVHRRLGAITAERRVGLAAIEDLSIGSLLLDRTGRILFANRAARTMMDAGDGIVSAGARLRVGLATAARQLSALISAAAQDPGKPGSRSGVMSLPTRSGRSFSVLVCPYPGQETDPGLFDPAIVVLFGKQHGTPEILSPAISRLYGLTPAEARLAAALTVGETLVEHAAKAGIAAETARGYLKRIFVKTGVGRQSALVATLLADPVLRLSGWWAPPYPAPRSGPR